MNDGNCYRFDLWLHNEMKKRGWNCLDLAIESGTSEKSIYEYIHNGRNPTLKNLCLILKALGKHLVFEDD